MEAAAETIRELRAILPERPHQLAKSPDWVVTSDLPQDPSFKEEAKVFKLGYMTFSSEADRGLVFTRSYDDVRPKPMPREVNLARTGHTKTISINDYKKKRETPPVTPSSSDARKQERLKPPPANTGGSGSKPGNSTLPLKPPPTLPPKPPTPDDSKKRRATDDGPRAQKRQRPSDVEPARDERPREEPLRELSRDGRAKEDRPREGKSREEPAKDDRGRTGRTKDDQTRAETIKKKPQDQATRDTSTPREKETSTLANGRSMLKVATNSRGDSPTRARGSPVANGVTNGGSAAKDAKKPDSYQKPNSKVPRLLSPLQLPPFNEDEANGPEVQRPEKKRRVANESTASTKGQTQKTVESQTSSTKRHRIPELLSPTLPPAVEAELQRLKKISQNQKEKGPQKETSAARHSTEDNAQAAPPSRMMVMLRVSKFNRKRFGLLMKITESGRQSSSEKGVVQRAEKRPRASSASQPIPPSTPSKKGPAAMSRVSSSNSVANTPGDAIAATPNVPDSGDRASQTRPPELREKERARVQLLKDKEVEFKNLGRSLKHKSDAVLAKKEDRPNGTHHQRPQSDTKSGWAHLIESLLCFVASFHCADVYRGLMKQMPRDYKSWASLGPLANVLEMELRHNKSARDAPMVALKTMVQLIATEEMLAAYVTQGEPSSETVAKIIRYERSRTGLLKQLRNANDAIENSNLRITPTPWALEDTVVDMLRVTRRWCADEGVKWSPALNLKDCGLKD